MNNNFDRRTLSKELTAIENDFKGHDEISARAFRKSGKAKIFGFTGSPGVGKSTLIDRISQYLISKGFSVAILAIDPTSPFSGGALLGDRARMHSACLDPKLFVRSSATRGKLGGLSPRTPEMINLLDSYAFDIVIIETVGVGQAELDVMQFADVLTLVLSPNSGDSLQTSKAGIIEVADVFALNKSDLPGIKRLEKDLKSSLSLGKDPEYLLIKSICAEQSKHIDTFTDALLLHYELLEKDGILKKRQYKKILVQIELIVREYILKRLPHLEVDTLKHQTIIRSVTNKELSPREAAKIIADSRLT